MGQLEGKVAIITGGGRGLGRAIAEAYLAAGARVVVTAARERAEVEAVAGAAHDRWGAGRALALLADVTNPAQCEAVTARAVDTFGRLDVLVNNAGRGMKYVSERFLTEPTRFWETDPAAWRLVIDANVNGPFFMARAAVPRLLAQGGGSIVNVSMNYGTMKRRGFSPYGPSKAALESASIIWAQDLAGTGVRVNVLLPGGATATGMIPDSAEASVRAGLLPPEIVGPPAVYLASDASRHVTGRRLVAARWRPDVPEGEPASRGIADDRVSPLGALGAPRGARRSR